MFRYRTDDDFGGWCPRCELDWRRGSTTCPTCGTALDLERPEQQHGTASGWAGVLIVVPAVVGIFVSVAILGLLLASGAGVGPQTVQGLLTYLVPIGIWAISALALWRALARGGHAWAATAFVVVATAVPLGFLGASFWYEYYGGW